MSHAGRAGLWFLYSSGIVFLAMELLSLFGVGWTRATVLVAIAVLALAAVRFLGRTAPRPLEGSPLDAAIALYAAAYASFAVAGAPWAWDFWMLWGLKARTYFEHGGIDVRFLADAHHAFVQPDYPQLVPLTLAFPAVLGGAWDDRWLGFLFAVWALAATLVVRDLAARELPRHAASAAALAVLALTSSRYIGLGETPLVAFTITGLLFTRRAILGDAAARVPAAILLGLAASTKNEGLTLLIAVAIALCFCARRLLVIPAGAMLVTAPWMIARAIYDLPAWLAKSGPLERLAARLPQLGTIAAKLLERLDKPWLWLIIIVALVLARRERFLVTVVALQLAFFLAVYLVTPFDAVWQIETSWGRLSRQLIVPATYAALAALASRIFSVPPAQTFTHNPPS